MINFKQLLHKKPEHPLASIEGANKVLAGLPCDDALQALEAVSFWLGSLHDAEIRDLASRIAVIRLLDEAAQPLQRNLGREYLSAARMNKSLENHQWMTLFEFWKRLAGSYFACLEKLEKDGKSGEALKSEMVSLSVRTMQALGAQVKLRHWRYRPADERIWSDISKLYLLAANKGFADSSVVPSAGGQKATSLQQELLKILMLEAAAPDRMLPAQIELADRLVGQFADSFVLQFQPGECAHYFDLTARKPPSRMLQGGRTHLLMRFFGAGDALARLQETLRQVKLSADSQEPIADELGKKNELLDLLHQLLQMWSPTPPQRKHERKMVVSRLNVVHGMAEVVHQLSQAVKKPAILWRETAEDMVGRETIESWVMENISESGLGAIIPELAEDWVRVGTLIGVRPEGGKEWSIGVVRRLKRTPRMEIYVGIEILAHEPERVSLRPIGLKLAVAENVPAAAQHEEVRALLLSPSTSPQGAGALLLEPDTSLIGKDYELLNQDDRLRIRLDAVLERGKDYEQVGFSMKSISALKR